MHGDGIEQREALIGIDMHIALPVELRHSQAVGAVGTGAGHQALGKPGNLQIGSGRLGFAHNLEGNRERVAGPGVRFFVIFHNYANRLNALVEAMLGKFTACEGNLLIEFQVGRAVDLHPVDAFVRGVFLQLVVGHLSSIFIESEGTGLGSMAGVRVDAAHLNLAVKERLKIFKGRRAGNIRLNLAFADCVKGDAGFLGRPGLIRNAPGEGETLYIVFAIGQDVSSVGGDERLGLDGDRTGVDAVFTPDGIADGAVLRGEGGFGALMRLFGVDAVHNGLESQRG